jgi:hypothetical protein
MRTPFARLRRIAAGVTCAAVAGLAAGSAGAQVNMGLATFLVDSFTARGLVSVSANQPVQAFLRTTFKLE